MPEYLAPGVFVEETSFRAKSIEGVSTTTTGFVGPTRYGPIDLEPDIVTSVTEFEYVYGDRGQMQFSGPTGASPAASDNFIWHAVRAFFEEGGKRLYVARIFRPLNPGEGVEPLYTNPPASIDADDPAAAGPTNELYVDGHARHWLPGGSKDNMSPPFDPGMALLIRARFPGAAGNFGVRFTIKLGQNILAGTEVGNLHADSLHEFDFVWVGDASAPQNSPPRAGAFYVARFDTTEKTWRFCATKDIASNDLRLNATSGISPTLGLDPQDEVRIVTLTLAISHADDNALPAVWSGIALDPRHRSLENTPDSLTDYFAVEPNSLRQARTLPIVVLKGDDIASGHELLKIFIDSNLNPTLDTQLNDPDSNDRKRSIEFRMQGGNDGQRPQATHYAGATDPDTNAKTGLTAFEDLEDISIIAAPGCTHGYNSSKESKADGDACIGALIGHATRMQYRIAVLDSGDDQSIAEVLAMRGKLDSKYAALYYPWVRIMDPVTRTEINAPPSGFVAGIYARNDIQRAVYKAPANEVVNLAIGFETMLNKAQQEVLNPEGINCFRFFEGRGYRLWGARTISSDPEWKYVNLRRYFAYLERSIDRGTQWAVFEPNGERLWANVRQTVKDFLFNEWQNGALLGERAEQAYFVRCDRSTMTQNDLDNGRLICLIGVAALKPAEFVIFRIGQWTSDRKA